MKSALEYDVNRASPVQIAELLQACDDKFVPPLSGRVEIIGYSARIHERAMRFEAWSSDALIGLVAIYCNDENGKAAFVTSVSVLPEFQGRGIGSQLVARGIQHVRGLGFSRIELEVNSQNKGAIRLYRRQGFLVDGQKGQSAIMKLNLA